MASAVPRGRRERKQTQRLDAELSRDETNKRKLAATKAEVAAKRKALRAVDDFIIAEFAMAPAKLAMTPNWNLAQQAKVNEMMKKKKADKKKKATADRQAA